MEIQGRIKKELDIRTGISNEGNPWRIASYVIETEEDYPKSLVFDVSDGTSGRIARLNIKEGKLMKVYFDTKAAEYNGKWYNRVQAYDARLIEENNEG